MRTPTRIIFVLFFGLLTASCTRNLTPEPPFKPFAAVPAVGTHTSVAHDPRTRSSEPYAGIVRPLARK